MSQDSVGIVESLPQAEAISPLVLSSRVDRLLATIVDAVVVSVVGIPLALYTGLYDAMVNGQPASRSLYMQSMLVEWGWFFLVNGFWLKKYGQSVGKRLLGVRISDFRTEAVPPFWRLLVRIALAPVVALFGTIGSACSLADILFIFGSSRRCIHDLIASTRVVDTWSRADS